MQDLINHVCLVMDASGSMEPLKKDAVAVADNQVKFLATRSKELNQETRMTVYTFSEKVSNVFYDTDVLRLPSLAGSFRPTATTALVDATVQAIEDLQKTATLYGDHAFLIYVLTDGLENASQKENFAKLKDLLNSMPENWTIAVLVPDARAEYEAKKLGFPSENIARWDVSEKGIQEVGKNIQQATDNFMKGRAQGKRGSKGLFELDFDEIGSGEFSTELKRINHKDYDEVSVNYESPIKEYVQVTTGRDYRIGMGFYELTKPETIQPQKQLAIRDRKTNEVFMGPNARDLLGLPNFEVKVNPTDHPLFDVFVQSTSVNRKLVPGTTLLVFHNL